MGYRRALWVWFIKNAQVNGSYGFSYLDSEKRDHLLECGIDLANSYDPELETTTTWGSTFEPNMRVSALMTSTWRCRCGKYGNEELAVTHMSLGEVIKAVVGVEDDEW